MTAIGRRAGVGLALLAMCASVVPAGAPAWAAHPGANGGLTYPVNGGIRVHTVGGSHYDIPYAPMLEHEVRVSGARDLAWTPDGRFLAFTSSAEDEPGIYVTDAAGCDVDQVTADDDRAPSFDGVVMTFTRGDASLEMPYHMDAEADPVSGDPTGTGFGTDLAMSILEGRWAHVEPPNPAHPLEYVLLLVDVFLRDEEVEIHRSTDPIGGTEWAPDGSVVAFEATADDGSTQIFVADVVGDPIQVEQVTDASPNAFAPAFSPDGGQMAWFRADDTRQSGIAYVRDLATGMDTFVTQQARFGLDWQSLHEAPWAAHVPIETTTNVSFDAPATGPDPQALTVTVSPAPPGGEVEIQVDDREPYLIPLDETGQAQDLIDEEVGTHLVSARFTGNCPYLPSSDQETVVVSQPEPEPAFDDIADSPFAAEIEWLAEEGITGGCAPDLFCPRSGVTRAQMASFLARALELPLATQDHFTDDDGTTHEDDINRLAEAGITGGCGPESFCPKSGVSRGQMASFLARARELGPATQDWYDDDDGRIHESNINRLAEAGITGGCGERRFCPTANVTRGQMAAFLYRALS